MDSEHNMTPLMDRWEEYDHLDFGERCYEYDKAECYQIIILKSKLTMNQIKIHNDGSVKGKLVRSLLLEIKYSETISMED